MILLRDDLPSHKPKINYIKIMFRDSTIRIYDRDIVTVSLSNEELLIVEENLLTSMSTRDVLEIETSVDGIVKNFLLKNS